MPGRKYVPSSVVETDIPDGQIVDFSPTNFDEVVAGRGVVFEHFAAMRCPAGLIDKTDSLHRPHPDHSGCSNGFIYRHVGTLQGVFSGNGREFRSTDAGLLDPSMAQITVPRTYLDGKPVFLAPMDRLFLAEEGIVVPNWEVVEASPLGIDRLLFPATMVLDIEDSRGIRYQLGDYQLQNGQIKWIGKNPGQDANTGKGIVYSVRYLYRPFWYVTKMNHEIRVFQTLDNDGNRRTERGPQSFTAQREYVFLNEAADDQARNASSLRQQPVPPSGGLPSR